MSFVAPLALLLCIPLCAFLVLAGRLRTMSTSRLPGAWHGLVAPALRPFMAHRSGLGRAAAPVLCFVLALLVVFSLARPGMDRKDHESLGMLAGRVVIVDVGSDLTLHRHVIDDLFRADPGISTALVAVAGDAYRVVPFTTDKAQVDRYLRVLSAEMMPQPGNNAHLGLALAERMLTEAGFPVRQILILSARQAPETLVEIPTSKSERVVLPLASRDGWSEWTQAQGGTLVQEQDLPALSASLRVDARALSRSDLPTARFELTTILIGLTALLWLLLFRRRTS